MTEFLHDLPWLLLITLGIVTTVATFWPQRKGPRK
jgi:hypothetical protein